MRVRLIKTDINKKVTYKDVLQKAKSDRDNEIMKVMVMKAGDRAGLVPKMIRQVSSKGKAFWKRTWIRLEEKINVFDNLKNVFDVTTGDQLTEISEHEYKKNEIDKKNVDLNTWKFHFFEYWGEKKKWDNAFKPKIQSVFSQLVNLKKERKERKDKGDQKERPYFAGAKYNMGLMRTISKLYYRRKKGIGVGRGLVVKEQGELLPDPPGVTGKSKLKQPYMDRGKGVLLSRWKLTRFASKNYIGKEYRDVLQRHQEDFVNLAMQNFKNGNKAVANFDGTGTGKTMQALVLAKTYSEYSGKPILITTQNESIFEDAFLGDAQKLGIPIKYITDPRQMEGPGIYVTSYSQLNKIEPAFDEIGLAIFDESHNLKNATHKTGRKSDKSRYGIDLINKCDNVTMMSATPVDKPGHIKYMTEAFGLDYQKVMKYLEYDFVTKNTKAGVKVSAKRHGDKKRIASKLGALFDEMTNKGLAVKRELSLDNVDINIQKVEMPPNVRAKYNKAFNRMKSAANKKDNDSGRGKATAEGLLALRRINEEAKMNYTVDKIKEGIKSGKQTVVFSTGVNDSGPSALIDVDKVGTLKEISKRLSKDGISHGVVHGGMRKAERKAVIDAFQRGEIKTILTTPQSGGTGLNLGDSVGNAPRQAIIMTPPFSAMEQIQMMGRINRLDTKSRAEIFMPITDTQIDKWNTSIIANKLSSLGGAVKGEYAKLAEEDLAALEVMDQKGVVGFMKDKDKNRPVGIVDNSTPKFDWRIHKKLVQLIKAIGNGIYHIARIDLKLMKADPNLGMVDYLSVYDDEIENEEELRFAEEYFIEMIKNGEIDEDKELPPIYPKILEDL